MPLDLNTLKSPTAAGSTPVQVKYTLSADARERLRKASQLTGLDMSTILEMLIREELILPGEESPDTRNAEEFKIDV